MKVLALPVTEERNLEVRAALEMTDRAVNELLALAVVESRAARTRLPASPAGQLHARAASAYTKSISVILDKAYVDAELNSLLDAGEFDIRKLANFARSWAPEDPDEPRAA